AQSDALVARDDDGVEVIFQEREVRAPDDCPYPPLGGRSLEGQHPPQPRTTFPGEVRVVPERPQGTGQTGRAVDVARLDQPGQGGPVLVVLGLEPRERALKGRALQVRDRSLCRGREVTAVTRRSRGVLAQSFQLLQTEAAQRLEHPVARRAVGARQM